MKADARGRLHALIWYWSLIVISFPSFITHWISWSVAMFGNYFKTALRNLKKYKVLSGINIFGLSMGMACCILILMWVQDELSFDRFHEHSEDVFRVVADWPRNEWDGIPATPGPLATAIREEIPEIIDAARVVSHPRLVVKYEDRAFFEEGGIIADPALFRMFSFPFVLGNLESAFMQPTDVVVTESFAHKYFGDENPLNKQLQLEGTLLTVRGVIADIPLNSHIRFDFVSSFTFMEDIKAWSYSYGTNWNSFNFITYIHLQPVRVVDMVAQKMTEIGDKNECWHVNNGLTFRLQGLGEVHLDPALGHYISWMHVGDARMVYLFSAVAVFILLIACVNFMNLSTARSAQRAKEVGMRKTVGAVRSQLIRQFLCESLFMTGIAAVTGLLIVVLFLPHFNQLSGKALTIPLLDGPFLLGFFTVVLTTGLIAGSYPAFMLSSFKPIVVLRHLFGQGRRGSGFRRVLVVFQFSLSILLIFGTMVVYRQMQFIRNRDLGFNRTEVLTIPIKKNIATNYETVKNELINYPEIVAVSAQYMSMTATWRSAGWEWEGRDPNRERSQDLILSGVDFDFFETLDMEIVQGRSFSREHPSDAENSVILNETAIREMELESPIGKWFKARGDRVATIIGVAKDAHFQSLHREIEARIFFITNMADATSDGIMLIRFRSGELLQAISTVRKVWEEVNPIAPFEYGFLDTEYARLYETERKTGWIFRYFTGLAILISCLGLFGLASFMAERRKKEIGIRKVLGAPASGIVLSLSKAFARWVLLANIIAWPIGYFVMKRLLQEYAYRIPLRFDLFVLSGLIALVVAVLTVSYQSFKAARAKPVSALKYE